MTQSINLGVGTLKIGGIGIISVLVIVGIALITLGIQTQLGTLSLFGGVAFGLILALLGVIGVVITILKRLRLI